MSSIAYGLSEEDTKNRYITPSLLAAGWRRDQMLMEYSLRSDKYQIIPEKNETVKVSAQGRNRPDYLLCYKANYPIAVIEAKSNSKMAEDGIQQAQTYAQMLGLPLAYASAGEKFIELNMVTGAQRIISLDKFPSPTELWDEYCKVKKISKEDRIKLESALYYTTNDGIIPRYYQMVAINTVVDAIIAHHRKRALLVMATGTGKTYTAFQIVWRLKKAGFVKNVLYLADRNQLIDQTIIGDFAPFGNRQIKITKGVINKNYEIYFGLYQQLKSSHDSEEEEEESFADTFRQVSPDYFDLIIVDECHRGSAREESSWREILDYFSSAVQIGLTATPSSKDGADNTAYFGEPLYTYSLKQGIEDGYLAPFQVVKVLLDKDETGWEPEQGQLDDNGKEIEKRLYTRDDFDRTMILTKRTACVARVITDFLKKTDRMSKTIVFCTTQNHAARMRDALRTLNQDMMARNTNYVVRMTGDDPDGRALYKEFCSIQQPYPVIVTTSKLLTTGADTKCVKLIVIDAPIQSMTEFKQIIGRGTRLREDAGKTFFTIMDFRGACNLFQDKNFDGPAGNEVVLIPDTDPLVKPKPSPVSEPNPESKTDDPNTQPNPPPTSKPPIEAPQKYIVSGVEVTVSGHVVSYRDKDGKLVTPKFKDFTRRNILKQFGSLAEFMEVWNGPKEKQQIIKDLEKNGVFIEHLRKEMAMPDADEFDLICSIAYGATPLTRTMRASRAARSKFLEKYQGLAREVMEKLLDIYAHEGVCEAADIRVLMSEEFRNCGGAPKIISAFGGKPNFLHAMRDMQAELYRPEG